MVYSYSPLHVHSENQWKTRCRLPAVFWRFLEFLYFHPKFWWNRIVAYLASSNIYFFLFVFNFLLFFQPKNWIKFMEPCAYRFIIQRKVKQTPNFSNWMIAVLFFFILKNILNVHLKVTFYKKSFGRNRILQKYCRRRELIHKSLFWATR